MDLHRKHLSQILLTFDESLAWGQLHSNVMHYHYITFEFACITLLLLDILESNALHYTLLFTNFKQTKLVHIETFTRTIKNIE